MAEPTEDNTRETVRGREISRLATAVVTAGRMNGEVDWGPDWIIDWIHELDTFSPDEVCYFVQRIMESMQWTPEELTANAAELDEFWRTGILKPDDESG